MTDRRLMTMRRSALGVATMVALTFLGGCASANSQTDGDISPVRGGGAASARDRGAVVPTSAAAIALAHASELSLAAAQRDSLAAIQRGVDSANAPLKAQLDSLRPSQRPVNSRDMSQEQRDQVRARRTAVAAVVGRMRDNAAAARGRTYAVLTPEQRTRVEALEADAKQRSDDELNRVGRSEESDGTMRRRGGRPMED
jgi:hypothetical protein